MVKVECQAEVLSEKVKTWLSQLTLEENARLCMGRDAWTTLPIERLGIPSIVMGDGPHGLRKLASTTKGNVGINDSIPATCFPPAALTSCSFNRYLIYKMGEAIGEDAVAQDIDIVLGPAINIKRSPLCGRNFEYVSEDPYVSGEYATAFIKGVQSKRVGTSLKHFAVNNQETLRMNINAVVDERALREIYLKAFETAVKEGKPYTVMASYNRINGEYGCENKHTLKEILREEWGFSGLVVSDWSAINDVVKAIGAGCDLEMPYSGKLRSEEIIAAVKEGRLKEETLDKAVGNLLSLIERCCEDRKAREKTENLDKLYDDHDYLARVIAEDSMVLLKNQEKLLPLCEGKDYALIGAFAEVPRYQGGGSSHINPVKLTSMKKVLEEESITFKYAKGYHINSEEVDEDLIREAVIAAKAAEIAIVFMGLTDIYEYEGLDRKSMALPPSQIQLLEKVKEVNENIIVVLCAGSAVTMEWEEHCKGILYASVMGQAGGRAIFNLLFGRVNPSGRLTETFPLSIEDTPSFESFPGGNSSVYYGESIYVGYRYYTTAKVSVKYPFGYGLSYTSFSYEDLALKERPIIDKGGHLQVSLKVKNTGRIFGGEVVQLYIKNKCNCTYNPEVELKDFQKIYLAPGEEEVVFFDLSYSDFMRYDKKKGWIADKGKYSIYVGKNSQELKEVAEIQALGEEIQCEDVPSSYRAIRDNHFNPKDFEALYGEKLPPLNLEYKSVDMNTPLGECKNSIGGKLLYKVAERFIDAANPGADGLAARRALIDGLEYTPIRSMVVMQEGKMNLKTGEGIVEILNGKYFRGLYHAIKSLKYHYK